jgi:hypothetical protein
VISFKRVISFFDFSKPVISFFDFSSARKIKVVPLFFHVCFSGHVLFLFLVYSLRFLLTHC